MRSFFATLRQLTLPAGAPPGTPRIVLGPDVPATLASFSADFTFSSAIIWYYNATDYYFEGVATWVPVATKVVIKGTYDITNGVIIYEFIRLLFNEFTFGSAAYNTVTPFLVVRNMSFDIENSSPFRIDTVSQARGLRGVDAQPSDSAAIGAQAVVLTTPSSILFRDGRAYEFRYGARFTGSGATTAVLRFQRTNLAGPTILGDYSHAITTTPYWYEGSGIAVNTSGANINVAVCLSLGATVGTIVMNGAARNPRFLSVYDKGAATDYPAAPQL